MMPDYYQQYMYNYPHKTAYRQLKDVNLKDYIPLLNRSRQNSLYFHIPYCESKCGYCNLFSVAGTGEKDRDRYLAAIERQIQQYDLQRVVFHDLTIGGGTPLYLTQRQLEWLFELIQSSFTFEKTEHEVIVETSPKQTEKEKLELLKAYGVTRISIGVQSFVEEELNTLMRKHSVSEAHRALKLLKEENFPCLNLDLIYGIPGQTETSLLESLEQALYYDTDEIFIYPLYVKEGTVLAQKGRTRSSSTYEFYSIIKAVLNKHGYTQTSMRRFVRKAEKKGNMAEYHGCGGLENTISYGCGGRSYLGNLHFCTPYGVRPSLCRKGIEDYIHTEDYNQITNGILLSETEQKRLFLIKNLFYVEGLPLKEYDNLFHTNPMEEFPVLHHYMKQGYVCKREGERLCLTPEGLSLSDFLGPAFISESVKGRMDTWKENL